LQVRYERLVRHLAPAYLDRNHMTYSGLAELVGVDRTILSRFINGVEGHTPSERRPAKVELLEKLERVCSQLYVIAWDAFETDTIPDGPDGDYAIWFRNFTERLRQLQGLSAVRGLGMVPEMYAQAMQAPAPWGASMCSNLAMVVLMLAVKDEARDASASLLRYSADRVRRLEARALQVGTETFVRDYAHRPVGYAGASLIRLGELLGDDAVVEEGLARCLDAVRRPMPDPRDRDLHWQNLLEAVERLLAAGHDRAPDWSSRVARAGEDHDPGHLARVHVLHDYPRIRGHWAQVAPELSRSIADARSAEPE